MLLKNQIKTQGPVSNIDTKSKILGHKADLPIDIAPTAMMKLVKDRILTEKLVRRCE